MCLWGGQTRGNSLRMGDAGETGFIDLSLVGFHGKSFCSFYIYAVCHLYILCMYL